MKKSIFIISLCTLLIVFAISCDSKVKTPQPQEPTVSVWDGAVKTDWYIDGKNEFELKSGAELAGLAKLSNEGTDFTGKTIKLANDIDLAGIEWTPINGFAGKLDGNNHTISNLKILKTEKGNWGLFGTAGKTISIENLKLNHVDIKATGEGSFVGGIIGYAHDLKISNCSVDQGSIIIGNKDKGVGGLVGKAEAETAEDRVIVDKCTVSATVKGNRVGGLIGYVADANKLGEGSSYCFALVNQCTVDGTIDALENDGEQQWAGGIFAQYTNGSVNVGRFRIIGCDIKPMEIKGKQSSLTVCSPQAYYLLDSCKIKGEALVSPTQLGGNHYIPEQKVGIDGILYYTKGTKDTANPTELYKDAVKLKKTNGDGYELVDTTLDSSSKWYKISNAIMDDDLKIKISDDGAVVYRFVKPSITLQEGYKFQFRKSAIGAYDYTYKRNIYDLRYWRVVPVATLEDSDWLNDDTKNLGEGAYFGVDPTPFVDISKYNIGIIPAESIGSYWYITKK